MIKNQLAPLSARVATFVALACLLALTGPVQADEQKQRDELQKMSKEALNRLYKLNPAAKAAVQKSAGHAVFSNFGTKILVLGGGTGKGVAFPRGGGKPVYMKMVEGQAGLGFGVKKFRQVWVFESAKAFNEFVNSGWETSGQATAAAKAGDEGGGVAGAVPVGPDVWVYQLTDTGLAAELTGKVAKYYKDDELN